MYRSSACRLGKTTLLVQRYLNLLERVNRPEEILAITFTRKAATEMKQRILSALETDNPVAMRVRQRDATAGWGLRLNPNRLKVQTIDSFAMELYPNSEAKQCGRPDIIGISGSFVSASQRGITATAHKRRAYSTSDCRVPGLPE